MNVLRILPWLLVIALASGRAFADEDDDDPKSAPRRPAAGAPKRPGPAGKPPAAPEKPAAVTDKPTAQPDKPLAQKPAAAPDKPLAQKPAAAPDKPLAPKPAAPADKPAPAARRSTPSAESAPAAPAPAATGTPGPARAVRVRLVDGSTVVGSVRAEQPEALVIDCTLGQLAIPRARISTIAYDAAAGAGQKRAPVQQLDDK